MLDIETLLGFRFQEVSLALQNRMLLSSVVLGGRPLVDGLQATGRELLIADARVGTEKLPAWKCLWEREAATLPDLDESPLFRTVRFYCTASPAQGRDQGPA